MYRRLFDAYDTVRALSQLVAAANATDDRALVTCAVLEDDLGSLLDECEELLIAESTLVDAELDSFVGRSETVLEEVALLLDQASSPQPTFSDDARAV